jgi:hypothetical protein
MKFYSFQIVIEKEPEDEGYYAYSPTLPGCFSVAVYSTKLALHKVGALGMKGAWLRVSD